MNEGVGASVLFAREPLEDRKVPKCEFCSAECKARHDIDLYYRPFSAGGSEGECGGGYNNECGEEVCVCVCVRVSECVCVFGCPTLLYDPT